MRTKKEGGGGSGEKEMHVSYASYMQMANFLAYLLKKQKENATKQITVATTALTDSNSLLSILKNHTQMNMLGNDIQNGDLEEAYPHIHQLLNTENVEETGGSAALPEALPPTAMKPLKPKKQRKERDPDAPKRPLTAFFLYLQDKKDETTEYLKKHATPQSPFKLGNVQKRNTEIWNALPEDQQQPYKQRYEENMKIYQGHLKAYKESVARQNGDMKMEDVKVDGKLQDEPLISNATTDDDEEEEEEEEEENEEQPPPIPPQAKLPKQEVQESSDESDEPEEESPPPRKESAKAAVKPSKEPSPERKKRAAKEEKKTKKAKEPTKSASPEVPKRKRKAEEKEPVKPEKKKKARKSQGYKGDADDF